MYKFQFKSFLWDFDTNALKFERDTSKQKQPYKIKETTNSNCLLWILLYWLKMLSCLRIHTLLEEKRLFCS